MLICLCVWLIFILFELNNMLMLLMMRRICFYLSYNILFFLSVLCPLVYRSATTSKSPAWYCAGSSCTAKQLFMSRHGYKTSWGVLWCLAPIVEPLGPVMSGVGASMDWTRSSPSNRCLIGLGYGEFGGLVDTLTSLSCPSSHSWAVFVLWRGTLSCWGGIVIVECCHHKGVYLVHNCVWMGAAVCQVEFT